METSNTLKSLWRAEPVGRNYLLKLPSPTWLKAQPWEVGINTILLPWDLGLTQAPVIP